MKKPEKILRLAVSAIKSKRARRLARPLARLSYQLSAIVLVLLVLAYGVGRLWLPTLAERKAEIAQYLSQRSSYHVEMEALEPYWQGLNPGLRIFGFKVYAPDSRRLAIQLDEVRISLSWLRLVSGRVAINSLVLVQPSLTFERLADGRLRISGLDTLNAGPPSEEDEGFIQWLLRQNELAIEDGELQWIDHMSSDAPLLLTSVNMSLRNSGSRHHMEFEAVFPRNMCTECRLIADVKGNPLHSDPWRGEMYVGAKGLNTRTLPAIVREKLPTGLEGRLSAQLWSEWRAARPVAVHGKIEAAALQLPIPGYKPVAIKQVTTEVKWAASDDGERWRLDMDKVLVGLVNRPWSAGKIRLEHRAQENLLRIRHLNLDDISAFVGRLPETDAVPPWLRATKPTGEIDDFVLRLQGDTAAPSGYSLAAEIRVLNSLPYGRTPGFNGLSGRLSLDNTAGEFLWASDSFVLDMPRLLPVPVAARKASGQINWQRTDTQWQVQGRSMDVIADDGRAHGSFEVALPHAPEQSPVLKLRFDFANMNGAHAANYYPVMLPEALRNWLTNSVVSGRVTSGHVIYSGAVRDFPFRDGQGKFEVMAHVSNGVFAYLPGWPALENIEADLLFRSAGLAISASRGRIRGLDVGQVAVTVDDLRPLVDGAQVRVLGKVHGPLDETIGVLSDSVSGTLAQYIPHGLRATGAGVLDLDISIPARNPHATRWTGRYRFNQNSLRLASRDMVISDIRGELGIGNTGVHAANVRAKLFGETMTMDVAPRPGAPPGAPEVVLSVRSKLTSMGLNHLLGKGLGSYLQGQAPWVLAVGFTEKATSLGLTVDLKDLGTSLPAPLDKTLGTPLRLDIKSVAAGSDPNSAALELHLGNRASGRFVFQRQPESSWTFFKGRLGVGEESVPLPEVGGLHFSVRAPVLDADRWWQVMQSAASNREPPLDLAARISVDAGDVKMFGRRFGSLNLDMAKAGQVWSSQIRGSAISGSMLIAPGAACSGADCTAGPVPTRSAVTLTLDQLAIPAVSTGLEAHAMPNSSAARATPLDPLRLPALYMKSKSLKVAGHGLGELNFTAVPVASGWHIESLRLSQALMNVEASGDWRVSDTGPGMRMQARLTTPNLGAVLDEFGYTQEMSGGKAEFNSSWSWPGGPDEFSLARLDGDVVATITDGRLIQVKQGAGRLLGIIDAHSLSRYLALDFSALFRKGLTFDSIKGRVTMEKSNAYTRDLFIKGASADIAITGRVGMAARDLDLDIQVAPRFKGELAVTGMLLGAPVVGVAVLAAQELLKKPLAAGTRIDYTVKGSWQDPQVVKVVKQTPSKGEVE